MSAQINLYHPRFLKQRDLLTLGNVTIAAAVVYAAMAGAVGLAWQYAASSQQSAAVAEAELNSVKAQVEVATALAATRKADPKLMAEVERAEASLNRRSDVARLLESGAVGSPAGFSDYLRGFARQTPQGLWLTGFTIGAGGGDIEIRGSMINPASLPDYIKRLGTEKAFQGRTFATLSMSRRDPSLVVRDDTRGASPQATLPSIPASGATLTAAAAVPAVVVPRPLDFVLTSGFVATKDAKP